MKTKNDILKFRDPMTKAGEDFYRPNGQMSCPWIFSSDNADVYWIAAYWLYTSGKLPHEVHKTRGHKWIVDGLHRVEVTSADHRHGVEFFGTEGI